ncbi:MAG: bifunctional UDP-N-acetylglucosamine diphosphorylase/glucosamine-1-phosphate N-acetyltransferase GlmU [Gammaproteobacteria bacterium]
MAVSASSPLTVVILAAGQGTRMRSRLPKVLHELAGRPLIQHVIETAKGLKAADIIVVYGHGGERVKEALQDQPVHWVEQSEQLGTGHAVAQAEPAIPPDHRVLVLYGDVPLIGIATLERLIAAAGDSHVALLTAELTDPAGYGRIVRDAGGKIEKIVEQKDATPEELALREVNTGMMCLPARLLGNWLKKLGNDNAQGEYYLTDIVAMAVGDDVTVSGVNADSEEEILGVNDRLQLAHLERCYQRRVAETLMRNGVTLRDPARLDVRGELVAGSDCIVDINVVFEGKVTLGENVSVGANCVIRDTEIGDGTVVLPNSVIEQAVIGRECQIGPFSRIRPESVLQDRVKLGNFVEVKKVDVGEGSKINHLSYVGDASVGSGVNIGAGCITCNYDGVNKHRTVIGDGAFIGSDTQLVAPVEVGAGAYIGAGSTITKDAPAKQLSVSRARQTVVRGWKPPEKK